jgi:hypothetical protein
MLGVLAEIAEILPIFFLPVGELRCHEVMMHQNAELSGLFCERLRLPTPTRGAIRSGAQRPGTDRDAGRCSVDRPVRIYFVSAMCLPIL